MIECAECGAPAEATASTLMPGIDFDGSDALFEVLKIECAAGHRYNEMVEEASLRLMEWMEE